MHSLIAGTLTIAGVPADVQGTLVVMPRGLITLSVGAGPRLGPAQASFIVPVFFFACCVVLQCVLVCCGIGRDLKQRFICTFPL